MYYISDLYEFPQMGHAATAMWWRDMYPIAYMSCLTCIQLHT